MPEGEGRDAVAPMAALRFGDLDSPRISLFWSSVAVPYFASHWLQREKAVTAAVLQTRLWKWFPASVTTSGAAALWWRVGRAPVELPRCRAHLGFANKSLKRRGPAQRL